MVKLRFSTIEAEIDGGEITTRPAFFAQTLQQAAAMEPSSAADPDQDYALAERLAARLDGQIIEADDPPEAEPGVVY